MHRTREGDGTVWRPWQTVDGAEPRVPSCATPRLFNDCSESASGTVPSVPSRVSVTPSPNPHQQKGETGSSGEARRIRPNGKLAFALGATVVATPKGFWLSVRVPPG